VTLTGGNHSTTDVVIVRQNPDVKKPDWWSGSLLPSAELVALTGVRQTLSNIFILSLLSHYVKNGYQGTINALALMFVYLALTSA